MLRISLLWLAFFILFLASCSMGHRSGCPTFGDTEGRTSAAPSDATEKHAEISTSDIKSVASPKKDAADGKSTKIDGEAEGIKEEVADERPVDPQKGGGKMTAGEWADLRNWDFWLKLLKNSEYKGYAESWNFANLQRVALVLKEGKTPAVDALVELRYQGKMVAQAHSDNKGRAELWLKAETQISDCQLFINGAIQAQKLKANEDNELKFSQAANNTVEIAFVVDATGSMSDELSFLQSELLDVIGRSKSANPALQISTSSVFYRDAGDAYVTRLDAFSPDANQTVKFIKKQSADGGGDFPEAVHSALEDATQKLNWSAQARTRLLFLILDAPPHSSAAVKASLEKSIAAAQAKGIKIIPIVASGINKETEFLMRYYAQATNGTYVFITDHSGIGNSHLEPTVGKYKVEFLADLMVRLIKEYSA